MTAKMTTTWLVALTAAALDIGCGSTGLPPPNEEWAAAQADVGRAQAGGAPDVPDARLHLQLAQEDLQKSRQLIGQDNARSTTLSALARSEAQLAFSLAKQAAAEDQARKSQDDLRASAAK
ncbi:MAG: DUF4398 domain-containing protein [Polyangiaceae bacterium]|jgi:hypothetical protein